MNVLESSGKKVMLLGNQAIVRGALESGVGFASTFPGTPASEIGDTFSAIAKQVGIYFEYSTNEKVALEAAAGASLSGVRSIVAFKDFGLNVASDSLLPLAYTGIGAGIVVVVADDPNCWSSVQSEQDSRWYARLAHLPMLEPSDAQECKDFTKLAFELSEKFQIPIIVRTTTRISHMSSIVKLGEIVNGKTKGKFVKDFNKFFVFTPAILKMHEKLLEKIEQIKLLAEKSKINYFVNENVKSKIGVIANGIAFNYVVDALNRLNLKFPVLKLGFTYPLPEEMIRKFIKDLDTVLIVEELDDVIEKEVTAMAKSANCKVKILGKNVLPKAGEYGEEDLICVLSNISNKKFTIDLKLHCKKFQELKIARRFPVLCPGCQHRATFYGVKTAAPDAIYAGDIGCYMLGMFPPISTTDFMFAMGAGEGISHGISKATNQKIIAFIGDGTFFHAGIPALINMVYNKSNPIVVILDNRATSMTGFQPHPGTGRTGMGEETKPVLIEDVVKACGVENVKVVDPFNTKEMISTVKEFLQKDKVSVIVAKRECQLLAMRRKKKGGVTIPKFEIDQKICNKSGKCFELGCPAILKEGNTYRIDPELCTGCAVCVQLCPVKAIKVKK
jgi:indolepyruvate ferredoxin oxidoreductase alpha subunit